MLYNEIHKTLLLVTLDFFKINYLGHFPQLTLKIFIEDGRVWSVSYVEDTVGFKNVMKSFFSSDDLANEVKKVVDDLNNEFGDNYQDNGKFSIS